MSDYIAEQTYRALLRADRDQMDRSARDGRTHPTYTGRWGTPDAIRCQEILGAARMQAIRFEEDKNV